MSAGRTLDRSRDYATVQGTGVDHRYEQDGRLFDAQGRELLAAGSTSVAGSSPAGDAGVLAKLDGSVAKITSALAGVSEDDLAALRTAEESGKTRKGVLAAIDEEVARRKASIDQVGAQLAEDEKLG